jgi:Uma2 family endonuclease
MHRMRAAFTRADYDRLPEGFPAQLVEGRLVKEPSPTYGHQRLQTRLVARLLPLVPDGLLVQAPSDVLIDDRNVYQPDVLVLRAPPPLEAHYVGTPLLALEILSPATAHRDRRLKTPRLLAAGVSEVWLVDPAAGRIERHAQDGVHGVTGATPLASRAIPGFTLVADDLFAPPTSAVPPA